MAETNSEFNKIYGKFGDFVYNVCLKILCNSHDAEDASQEVFVKVYKSMEAFRNEADIKTWLYKISTNSCSDLIRSKIAQRRKFEKAKAFFSLKIRNESSQNDFQSKIESDDLMNRVFEQLHIRYRTCIVLKDIEGLSYQEISEILNISMGTLKTRMLRGKKKLTEILLKEKKEGRI